MTDVTDQDAGGVTRCRSGAIDGIDTGRRRGHATTLADGWTAPDGGGIDR